MGIKTELLQYILPETFYQGSSTLSIAKALLGKVLLVEGEDQHWSSGIITEVEAYLGAQDKACHAYQYKKTRRNEAMFLPGGHAYVYFCYGMYYMFNIVTQNAEEPEAILVRAIKPLHNPEIMKKRRKKDTLSPLLTAGPGRLTQALNITRIHNKLSLLGDKIFLLDIPEISKNYAQKEIIATPRIGIAYANEDALKNYRFYIKQETFVSKPLFPKYESI